MHNPYYIKLITETASFLNIKTESFSDNWVIQLEKDGIIKYIIGYLFPLNDASTLKIANNKNLCSEILTRSQVPNVPHQIIFSPSKLLERKSQVGNLQFLKSFIDENGYPLLVKRNNSSKGVGVFLVKNEPELENTLAKTYTTDDAFCLSPFRKNAREFRSIILDGECLLSYEKLIPFLIGDGRTSIVGLLSQFINDTKHISLRKNSLFDVSIINRLSEIPNKNEKIYLQWQHNRFFGTKYERVENPLLNELAIRAANAIGARFVSVDIIESEQYGLEVLEINASVFIHSPISPFNDEVMREHSGKIFGLALRKLFAIRKS